MKRYLWCCLVSALVGGLTTRYLAEDLPTARVGAQEFGGQPEGFAPPKAPREAARGPDVVERLPADELTPEERVNVAVYDRVNRGVVNINTKGVRGENVLFRRNPHRGHGLGLGARQTRAHPYQLPRR